MSHVRRFLPFVVASIGLFLLSHQPNLRTPELGIEWQDKLFHCIAYWCYGATIAWALQTSAYRRAVWIIVVGTVFAISDEWHQSFIPGRNAELADLIADIVGLSIAASISWVWAVRYRSDTRHAHRP